MYSISETRDTSIQPTLINCSSEFANTFNISSSLVLFSNLKNKLWKKGLTRIQDHGTDSSSSITVYSQFFKIHVCYFINFQNKHIYFHFIFFLKCKLPEKRKCCLSFILLSNCYIFNSRKMVITLMFHLSTNSYQYCTSYMIFSSLLTQPLQDKAVSLPRLFLKPFLQSLLQTCEPVIQHLIGW